MSKYPDDRMADERLREAYKSASIRNAAVEAKHSLPEGWVAVPKVLLDAVQGHMVDNQKLRQGMRLISERNAKLRSWRGRG